MSVAQIKTQPEAEDQKEAITVLVVEDDALQRNILEAQVKDAGYHSLAVENGEQALVVLKQQDKRNVHIVIMDRIMPIMDGITAVQKIKQDKALRHIPIIMVTGAGKPEDIEEGMAAGVFYYLSKPLKNNVFVSVLEAAARDVAQHTLLQDELRRHRASFPLIQTCKFEYKTIEEAQSLAAFIARCFPDPQRVLPGLAELLINAVEHGNLDIGYDTKTILLENGTLESEINKRLSSPEYEFKTVDVTLVRKNNSVYIIITDQGKGFEWQRYLYIDPSRAGDSHGRGIAQANSISFDRLRYNQVGNQAIACVSQEPRLEW